MAASIRYIIDSGGVTDTILHAAAEPFTSLGAFPAALVVYALALGIEFFIASGSAKAFLMMPIILPLADLIGVTRQTAVLAYIFGDGFSNLAYPTNPVLLICLGLTVVGYRVSTGLAEGAAGAAHHVIGVSLSMLLMGLFLMVTRRKAVTQILALLTVENAVFLVALGATSGMPLVVELGISFDVIVAVLVLGILVHRIVDRFESMDVSRLSKLKG
jgi:hypothetical protein